jgi:hypothetical protein
VTETRPRSRVGARTIVGLALIFAIAPVFYLTIPGSADWIVVLAGLLAFAILVIGVVLAGGWLGVFRRRGEEKLRQQGCLQLLITLVALVDFGLILYYVVYYGASAFMRGVP